MAVRLEPTPDRAAASETVLTDDRELRLSLIEYELADALDLVRGAAELLRVLLDKIKD